MITHVLTLADTSRRAHVENQLAGLKEHAPEAEHSCFPLDAGAGEKLALATARNQLGDRAVAAGTELLIFLDADCIPGPELIHHYQACIKAHPEAVACGPVTYLNPPGEAGYDLQRLSDLTAPHPARPNPEAGEYPLASEDEYLLFWSLSFAMHADTWRKIRAESGGFNEDYEGYGGEDTDFALRLQNQKIPLRWTGGAHAYHQWHAVSSPPWEHLEDILRNARRFHDSWGWWPMEGWLREFARAGAIPEDYFGPGVDALDYLASESR
ncbi:hypothetical protein COCCU_05995 [Corynebacterium occultum]|uniref:Galactosyltransferase C-terminal domain-containing protein n=1 Tax=Corynebacterium occultum TaxID=2675219 RepID=A0A6B8VSK4_9CORY|nr:galactosyltransferase-related protein [Corynebacterium occultum]QGU07143.1 hypothetical protein COCCU_05995 [Corynebacterium occultum]